MPDLAGIIYSSAFQVTELINSMSPVFLDSPSPQNFQRITYKNMEMGAWHTHIATNERKTIWAMIDGKIHNSEDIKNELNKSHGFIFHTSHESEILVHAYEAWGEEFFRRLNGGFAIALFDREKEVLLLARDPIGQKSLYWTSQGKYWLFSTQVKGLLSTGLVPQTPSIDGMASYLYFGFVPQDLSPIQGVNKILPGHFLKVDLRRRSKIGQYWSFSHLLEAKSSISSKEAHEQFGHLFETAIRRSLPEEGNIAAFLSGDLGSSALAWFLTHLILRERIHSYSVVFDEPHPIELDDASTISKKLSISHQIKKISPEEVLQDLVQIVWHLDEPIADPFLPQTWYYGKLASENCKLACVHAGWIEMLAGSLRYFIPKDEENTRLAYLLAKLPKQVKSHFLLPLLRWLKVDYRFNILRNSNLNQDKSSSLFNREDRKKVSPLLSRYFDPEVFTQRFHQLKTDPENIDPSLYYDIKTVLPDRLLLQNERLLTRHGLQIVSPYLDKSIVEFLASLPEHIKFEGNIPAPMLTELMEKLCFECPAFEERQDSFIDTWRYNRKFRETFSKLQNGRLVEEDIISEKWIRQQLSYANLTPRSFSQLWAILVLEIWFRLYINRPISNDTRKISLEDLLS